MGSECGRSPTFDPSRAGVGVGPRLMRATTQLIATDGGHHDAQARIRGTRTALLIACSKRHEDVRGQSTQAGIGT